MDAHTRLGWVRLYERVGDAGLVCRRCGISRPTLRKWWHRYQAEGEVGLEAQPPAAHLPEPQGLRRAGGADP
jgi:transposase-like protein